MFSVRELVAYQNLIAKKTLAEIFFRYKVCLRKVYAIEYTIGAIFSRPRLLFSLSNG